MRPLWSGRFAEAPARELTAFSASIGFDRRLWPQDIAATRAHARALGRAGILDVEELGSIEAALEAAAGALEEGSFRLDPTDEDIHSALERFLAERLGEAGAKIHAGRSRNDLVATDLRLWLKATIPAIGRRLHELMEALYGQAREHAGTLAPGYTHLQRAQPVLLAHHLAAHAFALARDFERLGSAHRRADVSPLGAAAFAGTTLPLDAVKTASDLGFSEVFDNAADAVSDRDFALEFLAAAAILAVHLSRLGEEIVLWTSTEFAFASLDDAYATGSSIMPQKKNPDVAELARAKAARITANLVHLLGAMKGLPLTYNRDLQEDKEPVFDTADTLIGLLAALAGAMRTLTFDPARLEDAVTGGAGCATDLAEWLVSRGVPFREAHASVGRLVSRMASGGRELSQVAAEELATAHGAFDPSALELLDPRRSVQARRSHGGTAPDRVEEQLARVEEILHTQERRLREVET
ncbi:MAG: argininosuccinate lyase [Actinomycetota bacterium]